MEEIIKSIEESLADHVLARSEKKSIKGIIKDKN